MELNEVVRRLFGQHWRLIAFCVAAGIAAVVVLQMGKSPSYSASARLALDTADPETRAEAEAIADTAKAIATSPGQVQIALRNANLSGRDARSIAEHHVSVRGLGSSGVLDLSVTDRESGAAIALANALAAQVIRARLAVTEGKATQTLNDLDDQIADIDSRIAMLDASIRSLDERLTTVLGAEARDDLSARRDQASKTRASLLQERADVESQRSGLLSDDSLRPTPTILSRAAPPATVVPTGLFPDLILGVLAGLILGVGLAGLIETLRPTLVGSDMLARELDAPLLGVLPAKPDAEEALTHAGELAGRVQLAADAAKLHRVALVAAEPDVDMGPLAERLQAASPQSGNGSHSSAGVATRFGRETRIGGATDGGHPLRVQPFVPGAPITNGSRAGLIVVVPTTVKKADLGETGHLLATGKLPLLGVITYADDKERRVPSQLRNGKALLQAKARRTKGGA